MHKFTRITPITITKFTKLLIITILLATAATVASLGLQNRAQAATIQDCSDNSIIKCGVSSPSDLIDKIKADKEKDGDLTAIYNHIALTADRYDAFEKQAVMGKINKTNGDVMVNGEVVARDTWSLGRTPKPYSQAYTISGKTYHKSKATDVLLQDLPVMVWSNEEGKVILMVIAACGNPVGGVGATPKYSCQQLQYQPVKDQENTYQFSTVAPVSNGAAISKVVYSFGDGSAEVTRTKLNDVVTHTFEKSGTFTAKATVYAKLPNGREVAINGANGNGCVKRITIEQPQQPEQPKQPDTATWQCSKLTATPRANSDSDYSYVLRASASMTHARLVSADFDFGDGNTSSGVAAAGSSSNNISVDHTYAGPGTYKARVTLKFEAAEGVQAPDSSTSGSDTTDTNVVTCEVEVKIAQPPAPAPAPTPPPAAPPAQELPKTGVAGVAGVFTGMSALGTLGYRWQARRRASKVDDLVDRLLQRY